MHVINNLVLEKELIQQFINGSEKAFKDLYSQYRPLLYKFIQTFINDSNLTDDIVQEVFIAVWLNRKNIDSNKSFPSYLLTSARNRIYDVFKETSKNRTMLEQNWRNLNHARNETEEMLATLELNELVENAIKQLSSRKKAIFELSKLKGKTHAQIAAELGISQNTVKNHMVESLKSIKEFIRIHGEIAFSLIIFHLLK